MDIEHIDQLLPHVAGRKDFVVGYKDGYSFIDYVFQDVDTFDDAARLECRGIKFGPDGKILARPLAKFFNMGERPDTQPSVIDMTAPHVIMEKLDGSMIHPAIVNGEIVFMTRMGRTTVAMRAEARHRERVENHARALLDAGFTPIFEWTAPDNRIILEYEESRLTLLAIRGTITGDYVTDEKDLAWHAQKLGAGLVRTVDPRWDCAHEFTRHVRQIMGEEGFVLRFQSGLWLKAKGDDYVMKHKAKSQIELEKNALSLILADAVDDVLPLLAEPDRIAIIQYRRDVQYGIESTCSEIERFVQKNAHRSQKEFATEALDGRPSWFRTLAFQVRSGQEPRSAVVQQIAKRLSSSTKVDQARPMFQALWPMRHSDA